MRSSDWSSDVCSSDLRPLVKEVIGLMPIHVDGATIDHAQGIAVIERDGPLGTAGRPLPDVAPAAGDRQSVASGKSVSARVTVGGRRILKKNTIQTSNAHRHYHPRQTVSKYFDL